MTYTKKAISVKVGKMIDEAVEQGTGIRQEYALILKKMVSLRGRCPMFRVATIISEYNRMKMPLCVDFELYYKKDCNDYNWDLDDLRAKREIIEKMAAIWPNMIETSGEKREWRVKIYNFDILAEKALAS